MIKRKCKHEFRWNADMARYYCIYCLYEADDQEELEGGDKG